jgi:hypothetical protein
VAVINTIRRFNNSVRFCEKSVVRKIVIFTTEGHG